MCKLGRRMLSFLQILIVPAFALGCAVLETRGPEQPVPQGERGVAYFLPTNYVKVIVTNRPNSETTYEQEPEVAARAEDEPELKHRIELEVLPATPDQRQLYVAHARHKAQRDDEVTIETTPDGLLKAINITTADRTPKIIEQLAKLAAKVAQFAAGAPVPAVTRDLAARGCPERKQYQNEFIFDPSRTEERQNALAKVMRTCSPFKFSIEELGATSVSEPPQPVASEPVQGVYYRRPRIFRFDAWTEAEGRVAEQYAEIFESLAGGPIFSVQFKSGFLVERKYEVTFDGGQLTKSKSVEPSEILAAVTLPLTVLEAVGDSLSSLLQVNVKNTTESEAEDPVTANPSPTGEPEVGGEGAGLPDPTHQPSE